MTDVISVQTAAANPFEALRARFENSLRQKEAELEDFITDMSVQDSVPKDKLHRLFYLAHNIGGVAPTHGFHQLGLIAQRTEAMLSGCVLSEAPIPSWSDVMVSADELAEEIRACLTI